MIDKIYTAMVGNDTDGKLHKVDVIEHEGKLWLVPHWLEAPSIQESSPARIIRFDNRPHQRALGSNFGDYILNGPIPRVLLEPNSPKEPVPGFEYVELPDIHIPASVRPLHTGRKPGAH